MSARYLRALRSVKYFAIRSYECAADGARRKPGEQAVQDRAERGCQRRNIHASSEMTALRSSIVVTGKKNLTGRPRMTSRRFMSGQDYSRAHDPQRGRARS